MSRFMAKNAGLLGARAIAEERLASVIKIKIRGGTKLVLLKRRRPFRVHP